MQNMAAQQSKILPLSGSTSSDLNGKSCSPLTVQWTVGTYNLAKGVAKAGHSRYARPTAPSRPHRRTQAI
jgi:hypothetical protein